MESGLSTAASSNITVTFDLQTFKYDFGGGDIVVAARRFDAVRYIVVACMTIALMDRILILNRELPRIWSGPLTLPKFFYFLNRYPNLCCVGLDVFVFTQRVSHQPDCVWWFTFRTWAAIIVSTILEALLVFKLWILFGKCKYILFGFSTLSIAQTIGTSFLVRPRIRSVKPAPIPGEWFSGCFPLFSHPHELSHEWVSLTAVISTMALTAIAWTICTWRRSPNNESLWKLAIENSIFHIVGLALTTLFCVIFFLNAPQPLSSIIPSVSSTMFSVFGCRIALDIPDCPGLHNLPLGHHELEEISRRRKAGDIESATHSMNESSKDDGFSAVSNLDCIKPVVAGPTGLDISPLSKAATLIPAAEIIAVGEGEGSRGVHPTGQFHASEVTLSSGEAAHQATTTKTPAESRRSTLVGATHRSSFQIVPILDSMVEREARGPASGRRSFSPTPAAKAAAAAPQEEDDDFDELDRKLAMEYDEEGKKRPPRRTHQRQWQSEDYVGPHMLSGQGFLMPRASSPLAGRPASAIYYSSSPRNFASSSSSSAAGIVFPQQRTTAFPPSSPSPPPPSGSASPSRRRSTSPRMRMSLFFHRHRNDVGSVPVPEGEVPSSFSAAAVMAAQDPPGQQPSSRRLSTSSSRSRATGRVRRLLAGSPPPSSPLPPASSPSSVRQSSGRRRDSDAMTICTVSTGFAFDNEGIFEAPDFN